MWRAASVLLIGWVALAAADLTYWIQPCANPQTACRASDPQLAEWALGAWERAAGGKLKLAKTAAEKKARIRVYWASGRQGLYGEARPIEVEGKPGAEVYVLPDIRQLGPEIAEAGRKDDLFREAVVYLTCLHETGHALGMPHTAAYDDIMYSFGYGGDILEYFSRYRRILSSRSDIPKRSGMSLADEVRVTELAAGR